MKAGTGLAPRWMVAPDVMFCRQFKVPAFRLRGARAASKLTSKLQCGCSVAASGCEATSSFFASATIF